MKNRTGKSFVTMLAFVLGILCAASAPAQTFKHVKAKGGAALVAVSSGGTSVWALSNTGNPYILKGKQLVLANSISLVQIAVGGGNSLQADSVWGLDNSGHVYTAVKSGATWTFSQVPGVLALVAVGPGYQERCHPYEVWGLNIFSQIFRYNFCGKTFEQVPGTLSQLSVGGGGIWGINGNSAIFRFNFSTLQFDEVPPGTLQQIAVGPNGVWGLNAHAHIFQFSDNSQSFFQLPGILVQIQAGGSGVWGLTSAGQIFRLDPSTSTFVQIPGILARLSVGNGGGVWGINGAKEAYVFSVP